MTDPKPAPTQLFERKNAGHIGRRRVESMLLSVPVRSLIVGCVLSVVGCDVEEEIAVETIALPTAKAPVVVGDTSATEARPSAEGTASDVVTLAGISPSGLSKDLVAHPSSAPTTTPTTVPTVLPAPKPSPISPPKKPEPLCDTPPPACAGAIGFCPTYRCVDGKWVSQRAKKTRPKPEPSDPLSGLNQVDASALGDASGVQTPANSVQTGGMCAGRLDDCDGVP